MLNQQNMISMSVDQWINLPDHPIQRNTEEHARKALRRHLATPHPSQSVVSAVRLNGTTYKVDGHTRAYLWEKGDLDRPPTLSVQMWECDSEKELNSLYRTFDNRFASETTKDEAYSALKRHGIEFHSFMMRERRYLTALRIGYRWVRGKSEQTHLVPPQVNEIEDATGFFKDELLVLDSLTPLPDRFPVGIQAAALVTLAAYGDEAFRFWHAYAHDLGIKSANRIDAVEATYRMVQKYRAEKATTGTQNGKEMALRAMTAVERFMKNKDYSTYQKGAQVRLHKNLDTIIKKILEARAF